MSSVCLARTSPQVRRPLLELATTRFSDLTPAERALLLFADLKNGAPGDFAVAGVSATPTDPSNDPVHADEWNHDREVRAALIRWLCVDPDASRLVDPRGIRLLGARVAGKLDLSHVQVPFSIAMIRCAIAERMNFDSAVIPKLDLHASSIGEVYAPSINVLGDADIGWDGHDYDGVLRAAGEVYMQNAHIGGSLSFGAGKFHSSAAALEYGQANAAIDISGAAIKGSVVMCCGFESQGVVVLSGTTIGQGFACSAGHFNNPGGIALDALGATIGGDVYLSELNWERYGGAFEANGLVQFLTAHVDGLFYVHQAKFNGATGDLYGLNADGIDVRKVLVWQKVDLASGELSLGSAKVQSLLDDESSWPRAGHLVLDGFVYSGLGSPADAASRLRWLALQPPGLHLQPYRQLGKFLRESGDEPGALRVLIAGEDARYQSFGLPGSLFGWLLKWTVGYGHRPFLTFFWAFAVVMLGYAVVRTADRAGLMRPTYPENRPGEDQRYELLYPLLYSLDVFLPFVNLHQEHYWWPDARTQGSCTVLGYSLHLPGSFVLYYLWLQIIAGWLLSAVFIAGVTGLLRND